MRGGGGGDGWWPLPSPPPLTGAMVLESLARIVKVQLPAYLKRLPLPESVGGFLRLTGRRPRGFPLTPRLSPRGEERAGSRCSAAVKAPGEAS